MVSGWNAIITILESIHKHGRERVEQTWCPCTASLNVICHRNQFRVLSMILNVSGQLNLVINFQSQSSLSVSSAFVSGEVYKNHVQRSIFCSWHFHGALKIRSTGLLFCLNQHLLSSRSCVWSCRQRTLTSIFPAHVTMVVAIFVSIGGLLMHPWTLVGLAPFSTWSEITM